MGIAHQREGVSPSRLEQMNRVALWADAVRRGGNTGFRRNRRNLLARSAQACSRSYSPPDLAYDPFGEAVSNRIVQADGAAERGHSGPATPRAVSI